MHSRRGLPNPFRYTAGSPADLRSDFALPRNSVSSSSSSTWITFRTCARAYASSVSHTGLDAASLLRIFLHMAVAPFVSGTRPGVLVAPERCHRLQLISTPFEVSSLTEALWRVARFDPAADKGWRRWQIRFTIGELRPRAEERVQCLSREQLRELLVEMV